MGREAKILLGFLGLLGGVFCGVLAMKLFVHRPPTGVGPDVPGVLAAGREPRTSGDGPVSGLPARAFAAAPPLMSVAAQASPNDAVARGDERQGPEHESALGSRRFEATLESQSVETASRFSDRGDDVGDLPKDVFVRQVGFEDAVSLPVGDVSPASSPVGKGGATVPAAPAAGQAVAAPAVAGQALVATGATALVSGYEVQPGDSWWRVAERVYGDGRLYRALFAWNRAIDPRVALVPGTRLEVPPLGRLVTVWPRLVPALPAAALPAGQASP
jgi:nucleoid-associated protein YgaU